jgi:hypothetical protein
MAVMTVVPMGVGRTWAWTRNFKELRNFKSRYGHMYVYRWKPAHAETVRAPLELKLFLTPANRFFFFFFFDR